MASTAILLAATVTPVALAGPDSTSSGFSSEEALRRYVQGRLLEERGEISEALSELYRAVLLDPRSGTVALRVSELSARQGESARSLEFADRALELEPGHAHALWLRGAALFNLGRGGEALAALEAAVAGDSDQVVYLSTLARVAEKLDRVDLVARAYARAVTLDEEDGESWFQLATAQARRGDFPAADHSIARAAEINPLRPGTFFMRGWVSEGLGRSAQAIDFYEQHLAIQPGDQTTRRRLVALLAADKRFADAYREAQVVARHEPEDFEAAEVATDLAVSSKHRDAGKLLADLEVRAQARPELIARVIGLLGRHRRFPEARSLADRWIVGHPRDPHGPLLKARALALAGEIDPAVAELRRAIAQDPDSLPPRVMLGRLLQQHHRFGEAASVWGEAATRGHGQTGIALELAFCREQLGDLEGAQRAVRDALEQEPDNPTVLNFLGYLLADHDLKLEEALALIHKALERDPANGAYIDSLGWVYYRMGRLAEARTQLERAVLLTGGDPVVHEHLGDVYKDLKLTDLARDQYQKSLGGDTANSRVRAKLLELR